MSISSLRTAVTAAGGTPTQYTRVGLLRELITAWGGTPSYWAIVPLLRQAITTRGGTPTQFNEVGLLRQLITILAGSPGSYNRNALWAQIATVSALAAPVITWTSGTAVRDPVFNLTQIVAGDNVELQVDDNSDFSSTYGDDTHAVTSLEAADGTLTSSIPTLAYATTYYARARYQRGGVWSGWSNTVSKTMDAAPASASLVSGTGATGAGANRSQYINTSGTPVLNFACNADVGAACLVRSTSAPPSKGHYEVTVGTIIAGSKLLIGVSDSALALGAAVFTYPGQTGAGCMLRAIQNSTSWVVFANGTTAVVTAPNALAAADIIIVEFDTAAKTVTFKVKRGGTTTTLSTTTLTSNIPTNWTATVGADAANGDSGTCNFGATAFAVTPTAGYSGW